MIKSFACYYVKCFDEPACFLKEPLNIGLDIKLAEQKLNFTLYNVTVLKIGKIINTFIWWQEGFELVILTSKLLNYSCLKHFIIEKQLLFQGFWFYLNEKLCFHMNFQTGRTKNSVLARFSYFFFNQFLEKGSQR